MSEIDQRPKVTVEDLLRLKRAERPADEFWTGFERELRQKQLTALLEKRPWWQGFPQFLARRAYLPVGATAILAFTLVSVKYYAPAQLAPVALAPTNSPAPLDREENLPAALHSSPLVNRSEAVAAAADTTAMVASVSVSTGAPGEAIELMPLLVASHEAQRPSARLLADNLTGLEQPESDFAGSSLGNRMDSSIRAQATSASATDELSSVPTNSRRNRLLAQYEGRQLNPEPAPPAVVRERFARHLGDADSADRSSTRLAREIDTFSTPLPQIVALRF